MDGMKNMESINSNNGDLRIACLEPSATAICLALGLGKHIVGVTHECGPVLADYRDNSEIAPRVLTKNGLTVASQADIHKAVQETSAAAQQVVCAIRSSSDADAEIIKEIPSLYPLLSEEMEAARPTVIFTQDLCAVCAPTTSDVRRCLLSSKSGNEPQEQDPVTIVSLQPNSLHEVADTFTTVGKACGFPKKGEELRDKFLHDLELLKEVIQSNRDVSKPMPKIFILEWLDPPFDSGHWTLQMMEYACVQAATPKNDSKSRMIAWSDVEEADPDLLVVGCCGFDLERNIQDTLNKANSLSKLRAGKAGHIYACNGDRFIAQPAPFLREGVALLAQCAYQDEPKVLDAIAGLGYPTVGWERVDVVSVASFLASSSSEDRNSKENAMSAAKNCGIPDMEDIRPPGGPPGFAEIHRIAVEQGHETYTDPATGYSVFTEIAHKKRGKCCGSGCRHCPYSHQNVGDKASKIQQPSMLYRSACSDGDTSRFPLFSIDRPAQDVKVLFFSGGKDSFLAIRAMVKAHQQSENPFGLILLTTFDATTRTIAHQEVKIDQVMRQAEHLNISLVGIPLRRGSGETYFDRIQGGLRVVQAAIPSESRVTSLVFGDLHLSHIKEWRDQVLTKTNLQLEYPLWKVPYARLLKDLEDSQVPCEVSGSSCDEVPVGSIFNRELYTRLEQQASSLKNPIDGFGESGEFHSLAKVWEAPRTVALGVESS